VPLWRSLAFRKYHSACGAVVSAQLWKSVNARNGSGEAHRLAAQKTDMVRFDVFAVHQPQRRFCNRATRCSKEHTNPLTRDEARRIALNKRPELLTTLCIQFLLNAHMSLRERTRLTAASRVLERPPPA
jgi:hypothetical protein